MDKLLLKPNEAAEYLGIGFSTFYRLVRTGFIKKSLLPAKKENGKPLVMYHRADLEIFAEGCRENEI